MSQPARHDLILQDVEIALGGEMLLAVTRTIPSGDVLTVMGPSGSGKSTLLAYIGGFLDPVFDAHGAVMCGGNDITKLPPQARRAGLLFQDPLLFPHMSVGGNLAFALPASMQGRQTRMEHARGMLDALGLSAYFDADPDTLSGGQKARVALGRVLLAQPAFLLLDEPFSKLDAALRGQMRDLVFDRARAAGLPVLLVTHDAADAQAAGGDVIEVGGA
ncbi:MAG: ATP-binding cassette domain-containing protein [Pseudomonadota bacterium]